MGVTAFKSQPTSEAVRAFLGRTIAKAKKAPRHIVCDRGKQFDCKAFRKWCRRKGIKPPRYGAIGKHGSIAVVERVILTIKCLLSCLPLVPAPSVCAHHVHAAVVSARLSKIMPDFNASQRGIPGNLSSIRLLPRYSVGLAAPSRLL